MHTDTHKVFHTPERGLATPPQCMVNATMGVPSVHIFGHKTEPSTPGEGILEGRHMNKVLFIPAAQREGANLVGWD